MAEADDTRGVEEADLHPDSHAQLEARASEGWLQVAVSRAFLSGQLNWADENPDVTIEVVNLKGSGDQHTQFLEGLEWADIPDLIVALQAAYRAGVYYRIFPTALSKLQRLQRDGESMENDAPPEENDAPSKPDAERDHEYDAGDSWKRGTKYDHTLPENR